MGTFLLVISNDYEVPVKPVAIQFQSVYRENYLSKMAFDMIF